MASSNVNSKANCIKDVRYMKITFEVEGGEQLTVDLVLENNAMNVSHQNKETRGQWIPLIYPSVTLKSSEIVYHLEHIRA